LTFSDQRPLKLGECAHDRKQECGHRGVVTGEGELFLYELDLDTAGGEAAHSGAQVVEVAGQPVHRVHHHGVTLADELQHRRQLRPVQVLARHVVGEGAVDLDAVQLPVGVLLQGADPGVADPLTVDDRPQP